MTHIRISINGELQFDGDPGKWTSKPPDFIKDLITPDGVKQPQPHMKAIMLAMTDAVIRNQSVKVDASTWDHGWSISVEEK